MREKFKLQNVVTLTSLGKVFYIQSLEGLGKDKEKGGPILISCLK